MSTTPSPINPTNLANLANEVGQIGNIASQVLPSSSGQVQRVTSYVELGIATLPLFGNLFQTIGAFFHHVSKVMTMPPQAQTETQPAAVTASTTTSTVSSGTGVTQ